MAHGRVGFFISSEWRWNIFETGLVLMAFWNLATADISDESNPGTNLTFMRVLRVFKMGRVVRVVRALHLFEHLRLYLDEIFGSLLALMWLFVLLFVILFIFAVIFMQGTIIWLRDNPKADQEVRRYLLKSFKDVPTAILTLFKSVSGGEDWGVVEEHLAEMGNAYRMLFIGYLFFSLFGVLNV